MFVENVLPNNKQSLRKKYGTYRESSGIGIPEFVQTLLDWCGVNYLLLPTAAVRLSYPASSES